MFTIAEVIKLLTRIFAKQNKRFPKGLEAVDIRLKAKKIHDVGKANNYEGAISENQLKHFLAFEKQAPITREVSKDIIKVPKKGGEVFDLTGKKIDTSKPILGGKNVPETEEQILQRLNKQNKESVERLKNKKLEVWGDGTPLREYTYSQDMANAFFWCFENYSSNTIINIGSNEERSIREIIYYIAESMNFNKENIIFDNSKPTGVLKKSMDNKNFLELSNYKFLSLKEGIKKTVGWYMKAYEQNTETLKENLKN